MMMKVYQVAVGNMQNFTYVVADTQTAECIIIDPSWDLEKIQEIVSRKSLSVKYIVNTHHHFDHTVGNQALAKAFGVKIIQHKNSEIEHDIDVTHGDTISFGESKLKVYHTPGHSLDSMCLVGDGKLFSGDTLFVGNCGRIDLPGGSAKDLYHSLFDIIYNLEDDLEIFPGHDYGSEPTSTVQREKATNFVLQKRSEDEFVQLMSG